MWSLLKADSSMRAWVLHTLPVVGWLLAGGEACYCTGGASHAGANAQARRSAIAAVLVVRIAALQVAPRLEHDCCHASELT